MPAQQMHMLEPTPLQWGAGPLAMLLWLNW
jgi:hypothetical protein